MCSQFRQHLLGSISCNVPIKRYYHNSIFLPLHTSLCRTFFTLPEVQSRHEKERRKVEAAASWERRKIYEKVNIVKTGRSDVVSLVGLGAGSAVAT